MKKNDLAFFYHSNEGLEIGNRESGQRSLPDPKTDEVAWVAVDVKPVRKLKKPVSLETIKKINDWPIWPWSN